MDEYNALVAPDAETWLALSEYERLYMIEEYHQSLEEDWADEVEQERAHSSIQMVVENQLALGEKNVVEALARLQRQGLDRHDALHAIASVLVELIYEILNSETGEANKTYNRRVKKLTAKKWLKGR